MASLSMKRGDTEVYDVVVTKANGDRQSLVGCSLRMTAKYRDSDSDDDAVFRLTEGSGIETTNAANGEATITISPSDTSALTFPRALDYDVQLTDGSGNVYTVDSGTLAVSMDISVTTP